jgi:hypothetical protein
VLVRAQQPAGQSRTLRDVLVGNPAKCCRVISGVELEVQFLDNSTARVAVSPPVQAAPSQGTAQPARPSGPLANPTNPLTAANPAAMKPVPNGQATRGFDENGEPYIEQRMSNGTLERRQMNGVTVIASDGSRQFTPANADATPQAGAPPELPADPARGRGWIEAQNGALLSVISSLVRNDSGQMAKFQAAESRATDNDVLAITTYRAKVAKFLASTFAQ